MKGRDLKINYSLIKHQPANTDRGGADQPSDGGQPPRTSREPLLDAGAIAERLNISLRSVRRMIADGRLLSVRIGRLVRVRPEALEALIEGK